MGHRPEKHAPGLALEAIVDNRAVVVVGFDLVGLGTHLTS